MTSSRPKIDLYVDNQGLIQAYPHSRIRVIHEILPEAWSQSTIRPYSFILHSNAGPSKTGWRNLIAYLKRTDVGIEPHFQVPRTEEEGVPTLVQTVPVNRRADCNAKANQWFSGGESRGAVSFETGDNGSPSLATTPWDQGQLRVLMHAMAAVGLKYNIPAQLTGEPFGRGVGYHAQFKEWSIYVGKTCPGAQRINQIPYLVDRMGKIMCRVLASKDRV